MSRRFKAVKKTICIITESTILAEEAPYEDFPIRKWTIEIQGKDEDIQTFVSKVEFRLHESFENPNRMVEAPNVFTITEKGWGEFAMEIVFYFVNDCADPVTINFSLKFSPERSLNFPVLNVRPLNADALAILKVEDVTGEPATPLADRVAAEPSPKSSKKRRVENIVQSDKVPVSFNDVEMDDLAKRLIRLPAEQILSVVDLIKTFKTVAEGSAVVDETNADLFKFDLYSFSYPELAELWNLCSNNK